MSRIQEVREDFARHVKGIERETVLDSLEILVASVENATGEVINDDAAEVIAGVIAMTMALTRVLPTVTNDNHRAAVHVALGILSNATGTYLRKYHRS